MTKFVKLESGAIVNISQIVAIKGKVAYTTALVGGPMSDSSFSWEFEVTDKDIKNILKAGEE